MVIVIPSALEVSCAVSPEPAVTAAALRRSQCDPATTGADEVRVMVDTTVPEVEPIYSYVHAVRTGTESRVAGTKMFVCPPVGIGEDQLVRILQCHTARAAVGRFEPEYPNDPFALPGSPLEINVVHEGGRLAVTVEAGTVRDNLAVLAHARAYADQHAGPARLAAGASVPRACVR